MKKSNLAALAIFFALWASNPASATTWDWVYCEKENGEIYPAWWGENDFGDYSLITKYSTIAQKSEDYLWFRGDYTPNHPPAMPQTFVVGNADQSRLAVPKATAEEYCDELIKLCKLSGSDYKYVGTSKNMYMITFMLTDGDARQPRMICPTNPKRKW